MTIKEEFRNYINARIATEQSKVKITALTETEYEGACCAVAVEFNDSQDVCFYLLTKTPNNFSHGISQRLYTTGVDVIDALAAKSTEILKRDANTSRVISICDQELDKLTFHPETIQPLKENIKNLSTVDGLGGANNCRVGSLILEAEVLDGVADVPSDHVLLVVDCYAANPNNGISSINDISNPEAKLDNHAIWIRQYQFLIPATGHNASNAPYLPYGLMIQQLIINQAV